MSARQPQSDGVALADLVSWLDSVLAEAPGGDYPGAWNGLQVEGAGRVRRIAAAVDASPGAVRQAVGRGAQFLLVHHGLFWEDIRPMTGRRRALYGEIFAAGLSVYSAHLPLDRHPVHGNNALLARALGLEGGAPFFEEYGAPVGLRFDTEIAVETLAARLAAVTGAEPRVLAFGPETARRVGVITGGAGGGLRRAAAEGVDTLITGEGPHWTFAAAEELGVNALYGGHYATETLGVRSLARAAAERFGLEWEFVDLPSGL